MLDEQPHVLKVVPSRVLALPLVCRLGRVAALLGGVVLTTLVSTAAAFSPNYAIFTTLRTLSSAFSFSFFSVPFVLSKS